MMSNHKVVGLYTLSEASLRLMFYRKKFKQQTEYASSWQEATDVFVSVHLLYHSLSSAGRSKITIALWLRQGVTKKRCKQE